jgi:predicted cupin superfamily sugar epimerase
MPKTEIVSAQPAALDLTQANVDPESPVFLPMMGVTMAPGFDPADYMLGERKELLNKYPDQESLITALTCTMEAK